jgi:hypothetical protein
MQQAGLGAPIGTEKRIRKAEMKSSGDVARKGESGEGRKFFTTAYDFC